jgi:hypothetical protein
METRPIFILLGLLAADGVLADAYKWTDEDGVVHYSDRPQEGAEKVELPTVDTRRASTSSRSSSAARSDAAGDAQEATAVVPFSYESIEVASPAAEETLWNIEGTLSVSLSLSPALRPGHQVRVYYDGTPQLVRTANFQLEDVYRGVHNIQVEVIDEMGKLMIRSRPSRFYVQQNTVF